MPWPWNATLVDAEVQVVAMGGEARFTRHARTPLSTLSDYIREAAHRL